MILSLSWFPMSEHLLQKRESESEMNWYLSCFVVWVSVYGYLQHSMGLDAACRDTVLPLGWLMWTRNTIRTRVFLRPMSVSPFLSSMSEFRSFRIPAQSILQSGRNGEEIIKCFLNKSLYSCGKNKNGTWTNHSNHWTFKCKKWALKFLLIPN